jgi:hypothetical protein
MINNSRHRGWCSFAFLWPAVVLAIVLMGFGPVYQAPTPAAQRTGSAPSAVLVPPSESLLHSSNLQYLGAFRVPHGKFGPHESDSLEWGGQGLCFNPANNSLFMVGNGPNLDIAEVSIPAIVNSGKIASLNTGTIRQSLINPLSKLSRNPTKVNRIGGLMIYDGTLIGTAYVYYDANNSTTASHFTISSLDFSKAAVKGLYQVGSQSAGLVAGWMGPIPAEWQAALGRSYFAGQGDLSIIGRTSSGPGLWGFDPAKIGENQGPLCYVAYSLTNPLGPYGPGAPASLAVPGTNPIQNCWTSIFGCVMVPDSATVLFFGSTATSFPGYGLGNLWAPQSGNTAKGPQSLNGQYATQIWAYNVNDLVSVVKGARQPSQVRPYDVWNPTFPNSTNPQIMGAAYDPATKRIYVSINGADAGWPLIQVYQVNPAVVETGPHIGSLTGVPVIARSGKDTSLPAYFGTYPGPVKAGDRLCLTAGNVFTSTPEATITRLQFFIEGTLVEGTATQSTTANAGSVYSMMVATDDMPAGNYQISVIATDSSETQSRPATWTLTIK